MEHIDHGKRLYEGGLPRWWWWLPETAMYKNW
jgi:hypothetical protein